VKNDDEWNCYSKIKVKKYHPLFILAAVIAFPFQIFPIPVLGTLIYITMIFSDHEYDYYTTMSRHKRKSRGGSNKVHEPSLEERRRNREKSSLKVSKKEKDYCDVWDDASLEEYYARLEDQGLLDNFFGAITRAVGLSETKEMPPKVKVRFYEPSEQDSLPDDYFTPEDEIRIDNLRNAVSSGHLKSVERHLKKKYNIYPTDFGYALERLSHDRFRVFLDFNIKYLKVWEGEDRTELLTKIIRDIETGELQLVYRQTLLDFMIEFNIDEKMLPENKKDRYECYYRVAKTMEDLGITKATRNSSITSKVI
jgi:hypothetical protein